MIRVGFTYDAEADIITIDGASYQGFLFPELTKILREELYTND